MKTLGSLQRYAKQYIQAEGHSKELETFEGSSKPVLNFQPIFNFERYLKKEHRGTPIGGVILNNVESHRDFGPTVCVFFFNESKTKLYFQVGNKYQEVSSGQVIKFDARLTHCVVNQPREGYKKQAPFWYYAVGSAG